MITALLNSHRHKDQSKEKFEEFWENSSYTLEPLYKTLLDMMPEEKIKPTDFSDPNHYAKMVWTQAQRDILQKIIDLMPKSLTTK